MQRSAIQLINAKTGIAFPAAPDEAVLHSSRIAPSRGLIVEHQQLAASEMAPHYVVHHRLLINLGPPIKLEWKRGRRWKSAYHGTGGFTLLADGEFNAPRWHESLEAIAITTAFEDAKVRPIGG
jgi:hypothetical protein